MKDKEFIPYEQALELKELGFYDDCLGYYYTDPNAASIPFLCIYKPYKNEFCLPAPIYQEAFRWFRENHKHYHILNYNAESNVWILTIANYDSQLISIEKYNTYEEAEFDALKKIIKIVKTK
jgi:hypothetical protein